MVTPAEQLRAAAARLRDTAAAATLGPWAHVSTSADGIRPRWIIGAGVNIRNTRGDTVSGNGRPAETAGPAGPRPLRLGSLCTGYGGLDMAAAQVLDVELAWVADLDPGAAATLAHHHPNVPNLGDITAVDLTTVPPIDAITAGYPCQPFSVAGKKQGTADERHLWPHIVRAIRVLRPQLVILENVANHLRLGFADVLADLAALGFDAEWCIAGASEVGAPHRRDRLFALAWPAADPPSLRHQRRRDARERRTGPADGRRAAADPARERRDEGWSEPARQLRGPHASVGGDATHGNTPDGAAVRRHATAGRSTHDPLVQIDDLDAVDVGAVGDRVGVGRPPAGHQLDTEPCEGGAHLTFDALGRDSMRVHGGDERHHIDS
ncbi:MAG TPA: DNA cytosine methyltransferase, partial [Longimicrobiales bacterium]